MRNNFAIGYRNISKHYKQRRTHELLPLISSCNSADNAQIKKRRKLGKKSSD